MPTTLGKNLHRCFSRIKPPPFPISPPPPPPDDDDDDDDDDYDHHHDHNHTPAAALMIKNFNSVYDLTGGAVSTKSQTAFFLDDVEEDGCGSSDSDSDGDAGATPDMATVYASQRFFFSSPGRSNSIIDSSTSYPSSASASSSDTQPEQESPMKGSIAIPTYSPDPYMDFRRSMQEMVEARDQIDVGANWDYLHQLLRCYLSLNPKTTHKYILGAFADLLVTLISSNACAADPSSAGADFKNNIPRRFM